MGASDLLIGELVDHGAEESVLDSAEWAVAEIGCFLEECIYMGGQKKSVHLL